MQVLLKSFIPKSLGVANVAEVALSARVIVNYTRQYRFWESVLEEKVRGKFSVCIENDFEVTERSNFPESTNHFLLHLPRCSSKKR